LTEPFTESISILRPRVATKQVMAWILVLGIFQIIHTLLLGQTDLESSAAPLHVALLGVISAFLLSGLEVGTRSIQLWSVVAASFLLTFAISWTGDSSLMLGAGWLAVLAWVSWSAFRGGPR
jgi:hypothetical protein